MIHIISLLPRILTTNDFIEPEIKEIAAVNFIKELCKGQGMALKNIDPNARAAFELKIEEMNALAASHIETIEHKARGRLAWKKAGF